MIVTYFLATCDYDGCPAMWPADGRVMDSRRVLWQQAKAHGWARDYESLLCPDHAPDADLINVIRRLAGTMSDAKIGVRVGMTRWRVQEIRRKLSIPGLPPGRPKG